MSLSAFRPKIFGEKTPPLTLQSKPPPPAPLKPRQKGDPTPIVIPLNVTQQTAPILPCKRRHDEIDENKTVSHPNPYQPTFKINIGTIKFTVPEKTPNQSSHQSSLTDPPTTNQPSSILNVEEPLSKSIADAIKTHVPTLPKHSASTNNRSKSKPQKTEPHTFKPYNNAATLVQNPMDVYVNTGGKGNGYKNYPSKTRKTEHSTHPPSKKTSEVHKTQNQSTTTTTTNHLPPMKNFEDTEMAKQSATSHVYDMFLNDMQYDDEHAPQTVIAPVYTSQNMPLTELYRPTKSSEVCGNDKNVNQFKSWIHERKRKTQSKFLVVLLYGPAGIGKTSMAHAILKEEKFQVYEVNASLVRTSEAIQEEILEVVNKTSLMGPTSIVIDEIDGAADGDNGAVEGILNILAWAAKHKEQSRLWTPIVCIANEVGSKPMQRLMSKVLCLRFFPLYNSDMSKALNRVIQREKMNISESDKVKLIQAASGDVRRMLTLLQSYKTMEKKDIKQFLESSTRDEFYGLFDAVNRVTYNPSVSLSRASDIIQSDQDLMNLAIFENNIELYSHGWTNGKTLNDLKKQNATLNDMSDYYDAMSFIDILETTVPLYREDETDGRDISATVLAGAIRVTRGKRHIRTDKPKIV
jgi:DNA polymerase III delta prime subunit